MIVIKIDPAKIKDVIGPGGKIINKIIADTGVEKIDIEDDGSVFITSLDGETGDKAKQIVENITKDIIVGETYLGTVTRTIPIGAFVQILPGKEGLVHIANSHRNASRRSKTSSKSATRSRSRSWRSTAKAASISREKRCSEALRPTAITDVAVRACAARAARIDPAARLAMRGTLPALRPRVVPALRRRVAAAVRKGGATRKENPRR